MIFSRISMIDNFVFAIIVVIFFGGWIWVGLWLLWTAGNLTVTREWTSSRGGQRSLICRFYRDYKFCTVRHHHVGYLCNESSKCSSQQRNCVCSFSLFCIQNTWSSDLPATSIPLTSSTSSLTASKPVPSAKPPGTKRDMNIPGCFSSPFAVTRNDVPSLQFEWFELDLH